jgi:hypothetical protein
MDILLRQQVFSGHARLIFDKGNGILMVFSLERKGRGHHLERNVGTHVQPIVVSVPEVRHGANDFKPETIQ